MEGHVLRLAELDLPEVEVIQESTGRVVRKRDVTHLVHIFKLEVVLTCGLMQYTMTERPDPDV